MQEELTRKLQEWVNSLSEEQIQSINEKQRLKTEKDYRKFKDLFSIELCSLCGFSLRTMKREKPCLHWLLGLNKFRKKDFELLYPTIGFFQMNAYLRWIANQEVFMKNINDLVEEKNPSKLIETTIKYKNLEWSFSCSKDDFEGHRGRKINFPHYHFQMRVSGKQFINFNDYHIPFSQEDIYKMIMIHKLGAIESYGVGGTGLQEGFDLPPNEIIHYSEAGKNEDNAVYHISTLANFEGGISGEELYKLIQESKETGQTMAKLLKARGANVTSIISPHESVPDIARRNTRK